MEEDQGADLEYGVQAPDRDAQEVGAHTGHGVYCCKKPVEVVDDSRDS